ncbi:hypothetical protein TWF106_000803 [Orbilia oligospora]|uniref:Uncharacterized protein n=1 Tax=Orbilia oligospora TaxID=2813651 RepID=A0A7C8QY55_ORBOL|nr:hypothetical protein TWF106_000803 [Orbilia oligospora]
MLRISSATLPLMLSNLAEKIRASSTYEYDWQRVTIATLAILALIYSYWVFISWVFPYGYSLNRVSLFYIDYEDPGSLKEELKRYDMAGIVALPVFHGNLFGPGKLLLANDDIETKDLLRVSARVIFLVVYHREASRAILTTESRLLKVLVNPSPIWDKPMSISDFEDMVGTFEKGRNRKCNCIYTLLRNSVIPSVAKLVLS